MICPRCGNTCDRDEVDVGIGILYGPWGCYCGWSEYPQYDVTDGPKFADGGRLDQWGGLTPE